jgi:large subunit ribosomal protein L25
MDVSCLPADLPEFITVDLSGLKKGSSFHLSDIKLPNRVKAVVRGSNRDPVVVSVVVPAAEVSAAATAAAPAAPAKGKGKGKK